MDKAVIDRWRDSRLMRKSKVMTSRAKSQSVTRRSSDVKNHWGDIVDVVNAVGEVVVTHDNEPEVVVVSMERYAKLKHDAIAQDPLATLRAELDSELSVLREPTAAHALRKAFGAKPAEIAKAANTAARRKR
jgi:prevent-host-death family protein